MGFSLWVFMLSVGSSSVGNNVACLLAFSTIGLDLTTSDMGHE